MTNRSWPYVYLGTTLKDLEPMLEERVELLYYWKSELSHESKLVDSCIVLVQISGADFTSLKLPAMTNLMSGDFDYLFFEKRTADVNFKTTRPSAAGDSTLHFKVAGG